MKELMSYEELKVEIEIIKGSHINIILCIQGARRIFTGWVEGKVYINIIHIYLYIAITY